MTPTMTPEAVLPYRTDNKRKLKIIILTCSVTVALAIVLPIAAVLIYYTCYVSYLSGGVKYNGYFGHTAEMDIYKTSKTAEIRPGTTILGDSVFSESRNLEKVTLPYGVIKI